MSLAVSSVRAAVRRKYEIRGAAGVWQIGLSTITGSKSAGTYSETVAWQAADPGLLYVQTIGLGDRLIEASAGAYKVGDMVLKVHGDVLVNANITLAQARSGRFQVRRAAVPTFPLHIVSISEVLPVGGEPVEYDIVVRGGAVA